MRKYNYTINTHVTAVYAVYATGAFMIDADVDADVAAVV